MGGQNRHTTKEINDIASEEVVDSLELSDITSINTAFPTTDKTRYLINPTFNGNAASALGLVFYENRGSDELKQFTYAVDAPVDKDSLGKEPKIIAEYIVDKKIAANVSVLSFFSGHLQDDELFEVRVIDNASARIDDRGQEWVKAVDNWLSHRITQQLIDNDDVGSILFTVGVVQRYLTMKKYKKFESKAEGAGFGVNVGGSIYTSTSQFTLNIVLGLDFITFREVPDAFRFETVLQETKGQGNKIDFEKVAAKLDALVKQQETILPNRQLQPQP